MSIIKVNDHYQIEYFSSNYTIQRYLPTREVRGKLVEAGWKTLESHHGSVAAAVRCIAKYMLADHIEEVETTHLIDIAITLDKLIEKLFRDVKALNIKGGA